VETKRERTCGRKRKKKNGQAIRILGYPEEKKREDSFFIPFPLSLFFF